MPEEIVNIGSPILTAIVIIIVAFMARNNDATKAGLEVVRGENEALRKEVEKLRSENRDEIECLQAENRNMRQEMREARDRYEAEIKRIREEHAKERAEWVAERAELKREIDALKRRSKSANSGGGF